MNFADVAELGSDAGFAVVTLKGGEKIKTRIALDGLTTDRQLRFGIRAESIDVVAPEGSVPRATVKVVERLGDRSLIYSALGDGRIMVAKAEAQSAAAVGDVVGLAFSPAGAHLFDTDRGYHAATTAS
jgi:multiple sugar transport system ATP-binding protein